MTCRAQLASAKFSKLQNSLALGDWYWFRVSKIGCWMAVETKLQFAGDSDAVISPPPFTLAFRSYNNIAAHRTDEPLHLPPPHRPRGVTYEQLHGDEDDSFSETLAAASGARVHALTIQRSQGFVWNQDLFVYDRYIASTSPANGGFPALPQQTPPSTTTIREVFEIRVREGEFDRIIPQWCRCPRSRPSSPF
ncbi:hypothetical protein K438DRAFT_1777544 [Mycena galopus ATCC 62051]|nr:hypothetical protein K438DRAFT_1777544 [Mycena galopus ATCC 62051]